jgi:hypothetical protein
MTVRKQSTVAYFQQHLGMGRDNIAHIVPEAQSCQQCGGVLSCQVMNSEAVILSPCLVAAVVYKKMCAVCNLMHLYDGHHHGIVNWNNKLLITIEMVVRYMNAFASSGQPVTAWWHDLCLEEMGMYSTELESLAMRRLTNHSGHLSEAMAGAAELVVFPQDVFHCCDEPECIAMDGTVISISDRNMPSFEEPWLDPTPCTQRASTRPQRQLPDLSAAQLQFVNGFRKSAEGVPEGLMLRMRRSAHPGVRMLAFLPDARPSGAMRYCVDGAKDFAKCLVRTVSPAWRLVPYTKCHVARRIARQLEDATIPQRKVFQEYMPILFRVYSAIFEVQGNREDVWNAFAELVGKLCELTEQSVHAEQDGVTQDLEEEEVAELERSGKYVGRTPNAQLEELWATGCYFPGRPVIRKVKRVVLPGQAARVAVCNKYANDGGACGPGVLLVYCVQHSNCIGFVLMHDAESPRTVFELMLARFRVQPRIIIYDNGCNLSEYVLNRAPAQFKKTAILVDGFHYSSHTNCAPSFDTHHNMGICMGLNTSLLEQCNARFAAYKKLAPMQKFRTFSALLRFSVGKNNLNHRRSVLWELQ